MGGGIPPNDPRPTNRTTIRRNHTRKKPYQEETLPQRTHAPRPKLRYPFFLYFYGVPFYFVRKICPLLWCPNLLVVMVSRLSLSYTFYSLVMVSFLSIRFNVLAFVFSNFYGVPFLFSVYNLSLVMVSFLSRVFVYFYD